MRFSHSILVIYLIAVTVSCASSPTITFPKKVDTKDKPIVLQDKGVQLLSDMGIHVSNDFPSARLNGVFAKNDSTLLLKIQPENEPINNSAFFAFKTWSESSKVVYFQFEYPKGYYHRYVPKFKIANGQWQQSDSLMFSVKDSIATLKFNVTNDTALIAAQELRTTNEVRDWYSTLVKKNNAVTRLKIVGKTHLGKDIPMLDIYDGAKNKKDIVVLLTRQHPPEVTGYLAFQSFLETILGSGKLTEEFLNKYRVLAFDIGDIMQVELI